MNTQTTGGVGAIASLLKSTLALAAILIAALGQYIHTYYHADLIALGLFAVALIIWLVVILDHPVSLIKSRDADSSDDAPVRVSRTLIACAFILAIFAFSFSTSNQISIDNLLAWVGSIVAFLYTFLDVHSIDWHAWLAKHRGLIGDYVVQIPMLIGIILIGGFFSFKELDTLPIKTDTRHSERVLAIDNVANGSAAPIFFDQVPGGEPLQFYLTAAVARFADTTVDISLLKIVTAFFGVLLIPLTFLLARELFGGEAALIAAFLLAVSKWTIAIARMGLPFIFAPVFVALTLIFLVRAFKNSRRNDFLWAGFFLGAGLYSYSAFRIVPFLVLAFSILWLARLTFQRADLKRYIANSALMFTLALVLAMPLLRYAIEQPSQIAAPMTYLIDSTTQLDRASLETLVLNLRNAESMFNWTGDSNPANAIPDDPALDYVTGGLFLLGVIYAAFRFIVFRESAHALVLLAWLVLVLPSALNLAHPLENPSIVRAAGAIPFAIIIAALPLAWLMQSIRMLFSDSGFGRLAAVVIVAVLLLISARANYLRYFADYAIIDQQMTDYK